MAHGLSVKQGHTLVSSRAISSSLAIEGDRGRKSVKYGLSVKQGATESSLTEGATEASLTEGATESSMAHAVPSAMRLP